MMLAKKFAVPKTYYVYTYAYPNGDIFYVGKGTAGRINSHEREAASGCSCQKCRVIRQIWESGSPVQKRIVFETLNEHEAYGRERSLIDSLQSPILTNTLSGVDFDSPRSPEAAQSLAAALEKDILDAKSVANILGVKPRTVLRLVEREEIPGFKVGDVWRFYRKDIEGYIQRLME